LVQSRLPRNAPAWLDRLSRWLEPFEACFTHVAQRGAFRRYLLGLLSDSRRKSMSAMWERVHDPGTYQAFQHFISHAPWDVARVWRQLRAVLPDREGVLILDATSFPKQGTHSVGVARQYCGTLGKVANCQVAVTAALWTGAHAWMLGAALYLPDAWLTRAARQRAKIPTSVFFQEKWRLALTLLRQARAAGVHITAVLGDADFGDNSTLRQHLHRARLDYALGVSSTLTVMRAGSPRPESLRVIAEQLPRRAWRVVRWRNGHNRPWTADFAAIRATPAQRWPHRRAPEIWVLFERDRGTTPRVKAYFIARPATDSLRALVRLAHHRWAIEQQYQELKDELGLDHFEGRSYPGWNRHVLLTALAYTWLQHERRRVGARLPSLPVARAVITEVLTAHFFVTHPHYLETMMKFRDFHLRI
jgi:SRSO17 transposase